MSIDEPNSGFSVSLGPSYDEQGNTIFGITLEGEDWRLTIWMTEGELALVGKVRTARWDDRGSIKIGRSANAPTFWSCQNGMLSILVGPDDECWDFGVMIPEEVIDDVIAEIEHET